MNNNFTEDFRSFISNDVKPAVKELETIVADKSRKHLQKLVFTNLVDRFDCHIDNRLLGLIEINSSFVEELLDKHKQPINESEILRLMLSSDTPRKVAISRLKDTIQNTILRNRHSEKLGILLKTMLVQDSEWLKPRVRPSGEILKKFTPQDNQIPASICGYADWLYSRRNAIVHGGGKVELLKNDYNQLQKKYHCKPAKTVRLSIASINTAMTFYLDLLDQFSDKKET